MAGQYNIQFVADTSQHDSKVKQSIRLMQDLNANVRRMGGTFEYAEQEDLEFVKSLGQLQSRATSAKGRVNEMSNAINEMCIFYNRMTQAEQQAPIGRYMSQSIKEASVTLKQYKAELASVSSSSSSVGSMVGGKVGMLMRGNLASFAAYEGIMVASRAVKDVVKTNMDFEQASANLAAVLGTTRGNIQDMTASAVEMSKVYRYTADDVLNLQTILARFGFTKQEVDASTASIIQLATATGSDLEQAAKLTASTLRAFNMSATESGRVASTLAVATTKSALDMETLATTMPYVSNVAHTFNLSLEDTVALVGVLADSGFKASQQGTGLRNVLGKIADSSSKLSNALGGNIRSLEDIQKAFIKLREEGLSTADIFGLTDQRVAAAFARLLSGAEDLTVLRDKITDVRDEMQKMIDEQLSTTATEFDRLSNSWDAFSISLSDSMNPLGKVAGALKEVVDLATKFNTLRWGNAFQLGALFTDPNEKYDKALVDRMIGAYGDKPTDADPKKQQQLQQEKFDYVTEREDYRMELDRKRLEQLIKIRTEYQGSVYNTTLGMTNPFVHFLGTGKDDRKKKDWWEKVLGYDPSDAARMGEEIAKLQKAINSSEQIKEFYKPDEVNPFIRGNDKKGESSPKNQKFRFDTSSRDLWDYSEQGIANWLKTFKDQVSKSHPDWDTFKSYREQAVDMTSLQSLFGVAKQYGMDDVLEDMRSQFDKVAENAEDVTKESWMAIIEKINAKLKELGKSEIEMDFTTGRIKNKSTKIDRDNDDMRILNGLMSIARSNKIGYEKVGIGGQKERIKAGDHIPNSEYEDIAKRLNEELAKRGVTWYIDIDFETGTLERLKTRIQEVMESIGSGVGGLKSAVGALDSIKKAGENMIDTLQSDADGWDKMMSVFNAAMAPLEAVVTIYEAINALKAMSAMLSAKEAVDKTAEVAAEVTGTQAEIAAEGEKVVMDKVATKAAMELATASFMAAHAGIPFAGFAIGAGFAESALALTKLNGVAALAFHDGGKVPGAPNGGIDNTLALLSPGEIILNRAQQKTLAPQLQAPKWGGGEVHVTGRIHGQDLLIVQDNVNRAHGGSRGYYARVK